VGLRASPANPREQPSPDKLSLQRRTAPERGIVAHSSLPFGAEFDKSIHDRLKEQCQGPALGPRPQNWLRENVLEDFRPARPSGRRAVLSRFRDTLAMKNGPRQKNRPVLRISYRQKLRPCLEIQGCIGRLRHTDWSPLRDTKERSRASGMRTLAMHQGSPRQSPGLFHER